MPDCPRFARPALALALLVLAPLGVLAATTLYDPALGSVPAAQGWQPLVVGAAAGQGVGNGHYTLDTTGAGVSYWGNSRSSPLALDTQAGFDLSFSLQLLSESHTSPNRAGYSLVMVGAQAAQSLELDFWADHIWAQDYSQAAPFVHGADVAFDTTAALTAYTLAVRQQHFTLSTGGNTLLSGALRDYTPGGFPYTVPNFLFLGDNSSRGSAISQLGLVSLSLVPEPAAVLLLASGLASLAGLARRRPQ